MKYAMAVMAIIVPVLNRTRYNPAVTKDCVNAIGMMTMMAAVPASP